MLTKDNLATRRDIISVTVNQLEDKLKDLQERMKIMKKEIANGKGAIVELNHLIDKDE